MTDFDGSLARAAVNFAVNNQPAADARADGRVEDRRQAFPGAEQRSQGLADAYREAAVAMGCSFFDAGSVTESSRVDGIHLDEDQHIALGKAMAKAVSGIGALAQPRVEAAPLRP